MAKRAFAFDIDNTISASPALFSWLTDAIQKAGGEVHIVTSVHADEATDVDYATRKAQLKSFDISYDDLYIAPVPIAKNKRRYAKTVGIDLFFDDRFANVLEISKVSNVALFGAEDPIDVDT